MKTTIYLQKYPTSAVLSLSDAPEHTTTDYTLLPERNPEQIAYKANLLAYEEYRSSLTESGQKRKNLLYAKRRSLDINENDPFTREDYASAKTTDMISVEEVEIEVDGRCWKSSVYRIQYLRQLSIASFVGCENTIKHYRIDGKIVPIAEPIA